MEVEHRKRRRFVCQASMPLSVRPLQHWPFCWNCDITLDFAKAPFSCTSCVLVWLLVHSLMGSLAVASMACTCTLASLTPVLAQSPASILGAFLNEGMSSFERGLVYWAVVPVITTWCSCLAGSPVQPVDFLWPVLRLLFFTTTWWHC